MAIIGNNSIGGTSYNMPVGYYSVVIKVNNVYQFTITNFYLYSQNSYFKPAVWASDGSVLTVADNYYANYNGWKSVSLPYTLLANTDYYIGAVVFTDALDKPTMYYDASGDSYYTVGPNSSIITTLNSTSNSGRLHSLYVEGNEDIPMLKWMGHNFSYYDKIFDKTTTDIERYMGYLIDSSTAEITIGDRGIFAGGYNGSYLNIIEYITISTAGNATDFGDMLGVIASLSATSNGGSNRGVFGGGYYTGFINVIQYITISTPGNSTDFGDLTVSRRYLPAVSNGTDGRGVFAGGIKTSPDSATNIIDYITISTTGNATDFGDLTVSRNMIGGVSNGTNGRGVFAGGRNSYSGGYYDTIDYITISTTGNATDFGDMLSAVAHVSGCSNGTNERGCFGCVHGGSYSNVIQYITINSTGNATDFGDLTVSRTVASACSNGTNDRGVFGGGTTGSFSNVIDYITISSTGNATDFGDLTGARAYHASCSNA